MIKEYEEAMTQKSEEIFNDFTLEIIKLLKLMLQFEAYNDEIYIVDKGKSEFFEMIKNLIEVIDFDRSFPEA